MRLTKKQIRRIADVASEAIDEILKQKSEGKELFPNDPINYGDLSVISVRKVTEIYPYRGMEKEEYVEVLIEEASPSSYNFQIYVQDYIKEKIGLPVRVTTEW